MLWRPALGVCPAVGKMWNSSLKDNIYTLWPEAANSAI